MKKTIILATAVALATIANAQMSNLTTSTGSVQVVGAGARLGAGSLMQDGDNLTKKMGFNGAVDGVYTYYFARKDKSKPFFGIRSGLSVAFAQNTVTANEINQDYKLTKVNSVDNKEVSITYNTCVANVEEKNNQLSVEIPVMASMLYNRIFANVGVRVGIPIMSKYKQTIGEASVIAHLDDYDVDVPNEVVFGKVEGTSYNDKLEAASFKLDLSIEGGYVLTLGKNWLSLGAYFNYGLMSNYDGGDGHLVDCDVENIPAVVTVNSLTKSRADKMGDMNFGVKAAFCWPKMNK